VNALRVVPLEAGNVSVWNAFVGALPEATFFHSSGWKRVIGSALGHDCPYLMAIRGEQVTGVLPLVHLHSLLFGSALISTAFCSYGGPVAVDAESMAALDEAARNLAERRHVEYLEYRFESGSQRQWPTESALYVTFRKRLPADPDALFASIPRKRRAELRKALYHGLEATREDDIDRFYSLYARNMHRHGTPAQPRRYFRALKDAFGAACQCTIVSKQGEPISGVMSFRFRDTILPYHAGTSEEARRLRAHDFMYWELMRSMSEQGGGEFDFGRSKIGTGAFNYKQSWGFGSVPLHYEYLLLRRTDLPKINPLNPKYRLLISLWKRLPFALANLLGPPIARGLG
jgi:FemAB-related protein (PEP-CTERM system-associated)